jgi:hypothetical protein
MIGETVLRVFLMPGDLASDALGARERTTGP